MHRFRTCAMQRALAPDSSMSLACRSLPDCSSATAVLYTFEQNRTPVFHLSLSGSATPSFAWRQRAALDVTPVSEEIRARQVLGSAESEKDVDPQLRANIPLRDVLRIRAVAALGEYVRPQFLQRHTYRLIALDFEGDHVVDSAHERD